MLTYYKVNSELALDWVEDNDLSIFIIVIATIQHEFETSTYVVCNKKHQKDVAKKFNVVGYSTIKIVSQFDVKIETSVSSLHQSMRCVGLEGLRAYLDAKRAIPFHLAGLKMILDYNTAPTGASTQQEEEEGDLGYPSPFTP